MPTDQRLIEYYIPIRRISAESRREKSIRKGRISTLCFWWARRPLIACRAAVYGALAPAPTDKSGRKKAEQFVADLCRRPGPPSVIAEARHPILEAHAERLTSETGHRVAAGDVGAVDKIKQAEEPDDPEREGQSPLHGGISRRCSSRRARASSTCARRSWATCSRAATHRRPTWPIFSSEL